MIDQDLTVHRFIVDHQNVEIAISLSAKRERRDQRLNDLI